jgi:NAD(P)-dependent dehydrogenase (short-subunit alcohol dehydrogenase family)
MSRFDLKGKVALVTGASSGLGVQFAKALAASPLNAYCASKGGVLMLTKVHHLFFVQEFTTLVLLK